jgi:hypothetical protein
VQCREGCFVVLREGFGLPEAHFGPGAFPALVGDQFVAGAGCGRAQRMTKTQPTLAIPCSLTWARKLVCLRQPTFFSTIHCRRSDGGGACVPCRSGVEVGTAFALVLLRIQGDVEITCGFDEVECVIGLHGTHFDTLRIALLSLIKHR